MSKDFLHDSRGDKSSKRLWGSITLSVGVIFSCVLFYFSIFTGAKDAETALGIINIFLLAGGSLLGIGVVEKFAKK